jgi:hypothetical protein
MSVTLPETTTDRFEPIWVEPVLDYWQQPLDRQLAAKAVTACTA